MAAKVTTPVDTIIAAQQLLETARDRYTRIGQRMERVGELLQQLEHCPDFTPEGFSAKVQQAQDALQELDAMLNGVYFADLDYALKELRFVAEKAIKQERD